MSSLKLLDSLETSGKGLKREKFVLEQKLKEMKSQKRALQDRIDGILSKRNQLQEINAKMRETVSVAQHKVSHTQEQQNTIQEFVDKKRKKQAEILETIEEERQTQMKESAMFEEDLSYLANLFICNQKYYKAANLEKEYKMAADQQKQLTEEQDKYSSELEGLAEQIRQFCLDNEEKTAAAKEMFIPPAEQEELIFHFDQCNQAIEESHSNLAKKHESLLVELRNVEQMLQ